jgi:tetratricopeptide (TPR) repeat protein
MLGGTSSAQGMITSLNNNKKLLRKKRYFKKERSFLNLKNEYYKAAGGEMNFKTASKQQLAEIRQRFIQRRRNETYLSIGIAVFVLALIAYFIYIQINSQNEIQEKILIKKNAAEFQIDRDNYLFFIADGDEYLKKNQLHNAIFQYKKALDIFPNEYYIKYRLAYAYTYRCRNEQKDCETGLIYIDDLMKTYPNTDDLIQLKSTLEFFVE